MSRSRGDIFKAINFERQRQDEKFGDQSSKSLDSWYKCLGEEMGELAQALLAREEGGEMHGGRGAHEWKNEVLQLVTVGVHMLEVGGTVTRSTVNE